MKALKMIAAVLIAMIIIMLIIFTIGKVSCDSRQGKELGAIKSQQDSIMATRDMSFEMSEQWTFPFLDKATRSVNRQQRAMHEVSSKENERLARWPLDHSNAFWQMHDKHWLLITNEMWQQAREMFIETGNEYISQKKRWNNVGMIMALIGKKLYRKVGVYWDILSRNLLGTQDEVQHWSTMFNTKVDALMDGFPMRTQLASLPSMDLTQDYYDGWRTALTEVEQAEKDARQDILWQKGNLSVVEDHLKDFQDHVDGQIGTMGTTIKSSFQHVIQPVSLSEQEMTDAQKQAYVAKMKQAKKAATAAALLERRRGSAEAGEGSLEQMMLLKGGGGRSAPRPAPAPPTPAPVPQFNDAVDLVVGIQHELSAATGKEVFGDPKPPPEPKDTSKDIVGRRRREQAKAKEMSVMDERLTDGILNLKGSIDASLGLMVAKFEKDWDEAHKQLAYLRSTEGKSTYTLAKGVDDQDAEASAANSKFNAFLKLLPDQLLKQESDLLSKVTEPQAHFEQEAAKISGAFGDTDAQTEEDLEVAQADMKKAQKNFKLTSDMDLAKNLRSFYKKGAGQLEDEVRGGGNADKDSNGAYLAARGSAERSADRQTKQLQQLKVEWPQMRMEADKEINKIPNLADDAEKNAQESTRVVDEAMDALAESQEARTEDLHRDAEARGDKLQDTWGRTITRQQRALDGLLSKMAYLNLKIKGSEDELGEGDAKLLQRLVVERTQMDEFTNAAELLSRELGKLQTQMSADQVKTQAVLHDKLDSLYPQVKEQVDRVLASAKGTQQQELDKFQAQFADELERILSGTPVTNEKITAGIGKHESKVNAAENRAAELKLTYGDVEGKAEKGFKGISEQAAKLAEKTQETPAQLSQFIDEKLKAKEAAFGADVKTADFPGAVNQKASETFTDLDQALQQVDAIPVPEDPSEIFALVHEAGLASDELKAAGSGVTTDMQAAMTRLRDIVASSNKYDEAAKTAILAHLDAALFTPESVSEGGNAEINKFVDAASGEVATTERELQMKSGAGMVETSFTGAATKVAGTVGALATRMGSAASAEEKAKAAEEKAAAKLAATMLGQAQEMQMRCIEEQDEISQAYEEIGGEMEELMQYVNQLETAGKSGVKIAGAQAQHDVEAAAEDQQHAADRLGVEVDATGRLISGAQGDLDAQKAAIAKSTAATSAFLLQQSGLTKDGLDHENQYQWELDGLLSAEDKAALDRSSTKIGATVDSLATAFDTLPHLEKVVMSQDDLAAKLKHHRKFLFNAAKAQGQKVLGAVDGAIYDQERESSLVSSQLAAAQQQAAGDLPGKMVDLDLAAPDERALQSVIEGGSKQQVQATLSAMRTAETDGSNALANALGVQADEQREASEAVREGQAAALSQAELARQKAEETVSAARSAGQSGAAIFMTLDEKAQTVDQRLEQLRSTVEDMAPQGVEADYQYTKAVAALARLESALGTMPNAPKHSLLEQHNPTSIGALLEASDRLDLDHDERLAEHADTIRALRDQIKATGGLQASTQQVKQVAAAQ